MMPQSPVSSAEFLPAESAPLRNRSQKSFPSSITTRVLSLWSTSSMLATCVSQREEEVQVGVDPQKVPGWHRAHDQGAAQLAAQRAACVQLPASWPGHHLARPACEVVSHGCGCLLWSASSVHSFSVGIINTSGRGGRAGCITQLAARLAGPLGADRPDAAGGCFIRIESLLFLC